MADANEFVNVLKEQFPISIGAKHYRKESIEYFWNKVTDLATKMSEDVTELDSRRFISSELWSNYDGLPEFKNDAIAAKYFASIIKEAIEKKPTALDIFKLERRIARLENSQRSHSSRDWKLIN